MRETSFIKQNKNKWAELEKVMEQKDKDPEELNELFIKVTDDLSYSRTFYPNRSVRVYLNGLAQRIFYSIYKNRRSRASRFLNFWKEELPVLVYESRIAFRLSFGIFSLAMIIGIVSSIYDPDFPRAILSDAYIDMTMENIESGDPMAVYKSKGQFGMAMGITINNIWVAFTTFILGVFYAVATIGILLYNGIMVGAFQFFFYQQGLLQESALTIWMHGALEISAIVIAGAAGLTMGRGLVFPGTLTRAKSFQLSARRGIKIMIGITPLFILAGIIEGYLTRLTDTPDIIRFIFIFICFAFVLGYFVVLPIVLGRRGLKTASGIDDLRPKQQEVIDLGQIKNTGQIFSDLFLFLRDNISTILGISAIGASLYCGACLLLGQGNPSEFFPFNKVGLGGVSLLGSFFNNKFIPLLPIANTFVFFFIAFPLLNIIHKAFAPDEWQVIKNSSSRKAVRILKIFFVCIINVLILYIASFWALLFFYVLTPFLFVWYYRSSFIGNNSLSDLQHSLNIVGAGYAKGLGIYGVLLLLTFLFLLSLSYTLSLYIIDILSWNIAVDLAVKEEIVTMAYVFLEAFILAFSFGLFMITGAILYYTLLEKETAGYLKEQVKNIGQRRTIRGMERENQNYAS